MKFSLGPLLHKKYSKAEVRPTDFWDLWINKWTNKGRRRFLWILARDGRAAGEVCLTNRLAVAIRALSESLKGLL